MLTIQGYDIEYVYNRDDAFVCFVSGVGAALIVSIGDPEYGKIAEYLASHPDALRPEPLPPAPTDAELETIAESKRQAEFSWQDTKVWVIQQEFRRGEITQQERDAALAPLDAFAKALRAMNNTPDWFRDPQWPPRPEV